MMIAKLLQPFARDGKRIAPPGAQAPSLDLPMLVTLVHRHIEKISRPNRHPFSVYNALTAGFTGYGGSEAQFR
jgi:hypothetical protein